MKLTSYKESILIENGKWFLNAIREENALGINPELSGLDLAERCKIRNDRDKAQAVFSSLIEILCYGKLSYSISLNIDNIVIYFSPTEEIVLTIRSN